VLALTTSALQAKPLVTKGAGVLETRTGSISECLGIKVDDQRQQFSIVQGTQFSIVHFKFRFIKI